MDGEKRTEGFCLRQDTGYFTYRGADVLVYQDIYPEGHQGGVSLLMNGERIAANGDVRFEPTPGQWQPVPAQVSRRVNTETREIETRLQEAMEKGALTREDMEKAAGNILRLILRID